MGEEETTKKNRIVYLKKDKEPQPCSSLLFVLFRLVGHIGRTGRLLALARLQLLLSLLLWLWLLLLLLLSLLLLLLFLLVLLLAPTRAIAVAITIAIAILLKRRNALLTSAMP